ncbi:hypothetical protein [Thalassospira lucentensis]|uniref:hypothetical protein n=1 Tax=Thalassospira lucentensis TaxID=168935 RepID=UPI00399D6A10
MQFVKVSTSKADYESNIVVRLIDDDTGVLAEMRTPIDGVWGPVDQVEKVLNLAVERCTEAGFRGYGIQIIDDDDLWDAKHGELLDDPSKQVQIQSQPFV